jgi:hypothetical protein
MSTILFLPIDIDLSTLSFTQKDRSVQLTDFNPYWDSTPIDQNSIIENRFYDILNQLPFSKITTMTHKIQQKAVGKHVDVYPSMKFAPGEFEHIKANEPCGYRLVLKGKEDSLEIFDGSNWITAITPSVPCCYLLNSTVGHHRVKDDPNREIIYIRGFVNPERHKRLIEKSLEKYQDHAITLL